MCRSSLPKFAIQSGTFSGRGARNDSRHRDLPGGQSGVSLGLGRRRRCRFACGGRQSHGDPVRRGGIAEAISLLVVVSCLGTINGMIFAGARVFYALGEHHPTFRWLAFGTTIVTSPCGPSSCKRQ